MPDIDSMHVVHPCAAGLDVHKMQVTATVRLARPGTDASMDTRVFTALPSGITALVEWLLDHRIGAAVMEATGVYWEIVYAAVEAAGIQPLLVHAQHVKQLKGRKTDVADSVWLARICQFGLCKPSLVLPAHFRALRKVSRQRRQLVRERARARNRIHKILDAAGVRIGGILSDLFGANGKRMLDGLARGLSKERVLASLSHHVRKKIEPLYDALSAPLDTDERFLLNDQLQAYGQASRRIDEYDHWLAAGLADYRDQIDLLMTVPGIDHSSALSILVELGPDIGVFASQRHCAAWAGLCPGNNESAGKRRSGRTRRGNTTLREVLIECAHGAARTHDCQFRGFHKALTVRRGYKRATVATAHKMLRVIYSILRSRTPYHDPETNYEELMVRRNAPRWIRMLEKYNINPATGKVAQPAAA